MPACVFWLCFFFEKNIFCFHCAGIKLYSREQHTRNGESTKKSTFLSRVPRKQCRGLGGDTKLLQHSIYIDNRRTHRQKSIRYVIYWPLQLECECVCVCTPKSNDIWIVYLQLIPFFIIVEWVNVNVFEHTDCYANDEESKCVHDNGKISLHIYRVLNIIIVIFFGNSSLCLLFGWAKNMTCQFTILMEWFTHTRILVRCNFF